MDTNLLAEVAKVQQDIHLLRTTIQTLQTRVDELATHLQSQIQDQPLKFTDLENLWAGADFSFETIQATEYQLI